MNQLPQALVDAVFLGSIYAIVAQGLTLTFGVLNVISFSHGAMITMAAYVSYSLIMSAGISFWLSGVIVILGTAALGLAMEWFTFRPVQKVPINGLIVSIGWIAILTSATQAIWGPNQRVVSPLFSGRVSLARVTISNNSLLVIAAAAVSMLALWVLLQHSQWGRELRATAQNREAAQLMGIRTRRVDSATFVIGASLAGLAGVLVANVFPVSSDLGDSYMIYAFIALIIGGAGSAVGAVIGSLLVGLAITMAQTYGSITVAGTAPFICLIVVLLVRPMGLVRTDSEATL